MPRLMVTLPNATKDSLFSSGPIPIPSRFYSVLRNGLAFFSSLIPSPVACPLSLAVLSNLPLYSFFDGSDSSSD